MNKKGQTTPFANYIVFFLLAGLFVVGLYTWANNVGQNYDRDISISEDKLDLAQLQQDINQTSADAKKWEQSFTSDNLFVALGSIVLFSIWGIFKLIWSSINTLGTIYFDGMNNVLGIDPMVTGVISAILIIGLIFAVYKAIKTGE